MRATYGGLRSTMIRHANREMVLCWATELSPRWSPGIVSITTKSIGPSDDRPTCNRSCDNVNFYVSSIKITSGLMTWVKVFDPTRHKIGSCWCSSQPISRLGSEKNNFYGTVPNIVSKDVIKTIQIEALRRNVNIQWTFEDGKWSNTMDLSGQAVPCVWSQDGKGYIL